MTWRGKKKKKTSPIRKQWLDLLILIKSAHLNIIAWNECITTMVIDSVPFCRWEICPMLSGMQGNLETPLGIGWPSVRLCPNRSSTKVYIPIGCGFRFPCFWQCKSNPRTSYSIIMAKVVNIFKHNKPNQSMWYQSLSNMRLKKTAEMNWLTGL